MLIWSPATSTWDECAPSKREGEAVGLQITGRMGRVGLWCSGSVNVKSTGNGECLDDDILPAIAGSHCNSPALAGASLHSTCGKISTSIYGTTPSTTAANYVSTTSTGIGNNADLEHCQGHCGGRHNCISEKELP